MQDSFEDYIKITRNAKPDGREKISKEMVATAHLKKECDARAMKIVEFSIEGKLRPEVFTRCLPFINQSHYQDIVEERAISKLCGYSVCGKRIPDMPKKQYFISTKSNKVYDITERKNFCSNFCYKASLHIKKQIDNSPLWLRKLEDIPEYSLLHSSEGGLPGEFIDQGVVKQVMDANFTSINTFAGASLQDMLQTEIDPGNSKNSKTKSLKKSSRLKSTMQTIKENEVEEDTQVGLNETWKITIKKEEEKRSPKTAKKDGPHKMSCVVSLPSIEENEEKTLDRLQNPKDECCLNVNESTEKNKEVRALIEDQTNEKSHTRTVVRIPLKEEHIENVNDPMERSKNKKDKTNFSSNKGKSVDMENLIKNSLDGWFTLESCIFIHGEEKVKDILNEKKLSEYFIKLKVSELQIEQQTKYMEICRRLQLQEMAEEMFDKSASSARKLKPLPDYRKLKADTKDMTLKVRSLYDGTMYEQDDTNFPTPANKSEENKENPEESPPPVLPPVDLHSQKMLRTKIYLNSLNKAMQQLLQSLRFSYYSAVLSDIQKLVKTFNLRADNITFKPTIWSYVALVLLTLLSIKDRPVREILEEPESQEYVRSVLDGVPNGQNFIDNVLSNVKNVETFIEKYITKNESDSM